MLFKKALTSSLKLAISIFLLYKKSILLFAKILLIINKKFMKDYKILKTKFSHNWQLIYTF